MTSPYSGSSPQPSWLPLSGGSSSTVDGVREADRIVWRTEAIVGGLVTVFSALLGAVVGVIWPRVAPHVDLPRAINGSEGATKALLGDDMWFALLGAVAGLVAVLALALAARDAGRGPGGVIGLAVGGFLGSLVAAQIGHAIQHPHVVSTLTSTYPHLPAKSLTAILGYFDFTVRARAVLLAWPAVAVAAQALVLLLRQLRHDDHA